MTHPRGKYFDGPDGCGAKESILLVEGPDDAYFFDIILDDIGANPERVGIIYLGSKDKLDRIYKSPIFQPENTRSYAIVMDADDNASAQIKYIHKVLKAKKEPTPTQASFTPHPAETRKVGLLILPFNVTKGNLEDVCLGTIPGNPVAVRTETFVNDTVKLGGKLKNLSKSKMQTYLANVQGELCRGAGRGFAVGHFDKTHVSLKPIKDFCQDLIT